MSRLEDNDAMSRELQADEAQQRLDDAHERLAMLGQLLTCAIAKLGGEMAVTTTEIERAIMGQQLSLTPLPHDRGFYVALVSHPGGPDVAPPAPAADVRAHARPGT